MSVLSIVPQPSMLQMFRHGMSTVEIADRLNLKEATVYNLIHRERCRDRGLPCQVEKNRSPSPRSKFSKRGQVIG